MKNIKKAVVRIPVLLLLFISVPSLAFCEEPPEKPLWEFVLFNGAAAIPHYRGSDEHSWYVVPLPYLIYRGEFLRINREGLRGVFLDTEHFETSISLWGAPPVDDNDAREGMPDLDAMFEVGPALKWYPFGRATKHSLYFRLACRAAFSADFDDGLDVSYEGLKYGLNLIYENNSLFEEHDVGFGFNAGIDFANSELHGYFYDVPTQYVREDRPFYEADSGYSGFSLAASLSKKLNDRFSLGFYSRWDNLSGAVYEDSPLVKKEDNFTVGAALVWKIMESKTKVKWEE